MSDNNNEDIYLYICFNTEDPNEIKIDDNTISLLKIQHIKTNLLELNYNFYPECLFLSTLEALKHGFYHTKLIKNSIQLYLIESHFNETTDRIVYFRYFQDKPYLPIKKLIILPWTIHILNDRGFTNYSVFTDNWIITTHEDTLSKSRNNVVYWNNKTLMNIFINYLKYLLKNRTPETINNIDIQINQIKFVKEICSLLRKKEEQQKRYIKKFFVFYCQSMGLK